MKIALVCEFSYPSKCGVWNVVHHTAKELKKRGHEIHIFSSNIIKGTSKTSTKFEKKEGVTYHRFPTKFKISENAIFWNFEKELIKIKPDIMHAHAFRHPHSNKVPRIAKKLKVPCYLTTHAPFLERGIRNPILQILTNVYDSLFAKKILNSYTKVFAISRWEQKHLTRLGCKKEKIIFLPNGVSNEFLKIKAKPNKKAIYMGRIAPVKNLETILRAATNLPNIQFTIYGPIEKGYALKSNLKNVKIINKPYNESEEIKELKKNSIFILPSIREGIPLSLLEAMASGLACLSSKTQGGKELIDHKKTGLLFNIGNHKELQKAIIKATDKKLWNNISKKSKESTKNKTWDKIAIKLEKIYKN